MKTVMMMMMVYLQEWNAMTSIPPKQYLLLMMVMVMDLSLLTIVMMQMQPLRLSLMMGIVIPF